MSELKSCPFCGGKAILQRLGSESYVRCHRCGMRQDLHKSDYLAIVCWNRALYDMDYTEGSCESK